MIYLVRHGETDWNLFKRCNGSTDTFLNKTGIEQAKSQADNLKNIKFDACFCSSQTRARQFCEIIYNDLNCDLCDIITKEHKGENILIVTHAINTRVINYYFTGKPTDYNWNKRVMEKGEVITFDN